jgi:hypothetical protein
MGFLLYAGDSSEIASQVILDIGNQVPASAVEVHFGLEKFMRRLHEIPRDLDAVVVIAGGMELDRLSRAWEHFFPSKLVLLLKQTDDETLAKAIRLLPSFLGSAPLDVHNVAPVLARIAAKKCQEGSPR